MARRMFSRANDLSSHLNDCIKSCRPQRIVVFDFPGEEDDGGSGRMAARCLQHAEWDLAG